MRRQPAGPATAAARWRPPGARRGRGRAAAPRRPRRRPRAGGRPRPAPGPRRALGGSGGRPRHRARRGDPPVTLAPTRTQLALFRARCEEVAGVALDAPGALHAFSVQQPDLFWRTLLDWTELPWSGSADVVRTGDDVETARFFPDVRLNYAEALPRPLPGVPDEAPAATAVHAARAAETLRRARPRAAAGGG